MIEMGDGWKFAERIDDAGFYEDQLMMHVLTQHRAVRRVFGENLCKDENAMAVIRRQLEFSAAVQHPSLPAFYQTETVAGCYTVIFELVRGQNFEDLIRKRQFIAPEDWRRLALRLTRMLQELRRLNIAFDRLNPGDVRFFQNTIRFIHRWPLPNLRDDEVAKSPFLQRLVQSGHGGPYLAFGEYPMVRSMTRFKNLLYWMASGQTEKTVLDVLEKSGPRTATLNVERLIETILMRMHATSGPDAISDLNTLEEALMHASPASRSSNPLVLKPDFTPATPAAPAAAPAPRREQQAEAPPPPKPDMGLREGLGSQSSSEMVAMDAGEDRSYLYPERAGTSSGTAQRKTGGAASVGMDALKPSATHAPVKGKGSGAAAFKEFGKLGLIIVVVLAVLGTAIYFVATSLMKKTNTKPTVVLSDFPSRLELNERYTLDLSKSTDPENDQLRFQVTAPGLNDNDVLFHGTGAKQEVQFFRTGQFNLELSVFDGALLSDPMVVPVEVVSKLP